MKDRENSHGELVVGAYEMSLNNVGNFRKRKSLMSLPVKSEGEELSTYIRDKGLM